MYEVQELFKNFADIFSKNQTEFDKKGINLTSKTL